MQIKPEQLHDALRRQAFAIVWVSGDEPLLVQEACDEVRRHAREAGFLEREVLDAAPGFDWSALLQSASSLSLFGERKLIDLRLASARPDAEARAALAEYAMLPAGDTRLLITSPRLDKATTGAAWFKTLAAQACLVQIWPLPAQQLPQWIGRRLRRHGLEADPDALRLLADRVEGNLLAAAQEVEKLALLAREDRVDLATVQAAVADSSRFNVFTLIDATLAGDAARALRILRRLQSEDAEPLLLLGALCRELRQLIQMRRRIEQGVPTSGAMQRSGVWSSRLQVVGVALGRHQARTLERLLADALVVDQAVKGQRPHDPWDELAGLLLRLAGNPLFPVLDQVRQVEQC